VKLVQIFLHETTCWLWTYDNNGSNMTIGEITPIQGLAITTCTLLLATVTDGQLPHKEVM
jgi:hypothetical protein